MPLPTSGLTLHVDMSDASKLFTTANGGGSGVHTGTTSDGSATQVADDQGDGIADVCLANTLNAPAARISTPLMALRCLDFDGTNDKLTAFNQAVAVAKAASAFFAVGAKTIAIAFYAEAITTDTATVNQNACILNGGLSFGGCGLLTRNVAGTKKLFFLNNDGSNDIIETPCDSGRSYVAVARHSGTQIKLTLIDDTQTETNPADVSSGNTFDLGGTLLFGESASSVSYFNGRIGELALYNAEKTGTDLTDLKNYFIAKWLTASAAGRALSSPFRSAVFGSPVFAGGLS